MLPVEQPFKTYTGLDGKPLDDGFVYFGLPNQNPITAPVTVYWDPAGTIPAAQPLRTVNGYIMRGGTPANVFFDGSYSELVQDKKRQQVFYARTSEDFSIAGTVKNFISGTASATGSALIGFIQDGAGAAKIPLQANSRQVVDVLQFGAVGDGVTDDTAAIQAAIDYAGTLVSKPLLGDPVGGARVTARGVFKITKPLIMDKPNVTFEGQGGCTINPYFPQVPTDYNGATPAFIVGNAKVWYTTGFFNTNKYNRIRGVNIKAIANQGPFIGIMLSGTRNPIIDDCLIENAYIGLYVENTSELECSQMSVIGATFGTILDNRQNRSANNSILRTACTGNDVSSSNFYMYTCYYSQWCGLLAINTGTIGIHGATFGLFAVGSSVSIIGLPALKAGMIIYGEALGNFTRSFYADNLVFEADQSLNADCVRIETSGINSPITGVTLKNCHVQTYASTPGGPITNFLRTKEVGGKITAVAVENCGYTPQSSGYYYGTMHIVEAGYPIVHFRDCYPGAAFNSMGNDFGYFCKVAGVVELDNIIPPTEYPPVGWTGNGTAGVVQGGSQGQFAYLRWTGSMNEMSISKQLVYREVSPHVGYVYISFLARGDKGLLVRARVNGQADTDSTLNNGTNQARYSNAISQPKALSTTNWQRVVYCFNSFGAGYDFDNVIFTIGKAASDSPTDFIEIADVRIGYIEGGLTKYNPFS